jgi:SAM-dependent methyltransferase
MILNLGSGCTNFGPRVVNLDIEPFLNVDVVAVGERLPLLDASLDAVITQGVLEHIPDLSGTLAEIDRVLRQGGLVYHEIPFIQGYHGSYGDYRHFTLTGLRELAPGYEVLDSGVVVGPSSGILWVGSVWLALLFSFNNETLFKAGRRIFAWLLSPIKLADAWLERHPHADLIASAFFIVAQKPVT